jgi:hypothetical protein
MSLLLAACSTSPESLENETRDLSGVVKVEAVENGGDNDIPFAKIPKHVTILMDADASTTQIMAVFDAYDGDIDDGDVGGIDVVLDAPKRATLATGEDIHATTSMVDELVTVQREDRIIEYRREVYPVLASVHLSLASGDFDDVVAVADRYRNDDEIDDVEVSSGDFALVRDEVNEDPEFTAAREKFVQQVALHFQLRGALVAGRGPLRLAVAPSDQAALRRFVERRPGAHGLGRVRVSTNAEAPS